MKIARRGDRQTFRYIDIYKDIATYRLNQPRGRISENSPHNFTYSVCADMENVMSLPSAARVKFQSLGKLLALNIRCFVVNVVSVDISHCF